jgi:two-component system, cell cycle sensor histidine kinase and response regulator CckA
MSESDGGQGRHGAEFPTDIEQALTERIKELRTLYSVGQLLAASEERPLADRLAEIARLLPAAFQFPDITAARLVVADRSYESGGFLETPWLQTSRIGGAGPDAIGRIDVALLEPFEGRAQQPFLAEEVELLEALASAVAQAVRRDRAEQELRRSQERFHQIADHIHLVFWIREVGKNRLEYVSPAYEQVWGRPAAELYEDLSPLLTYVLPSDRARMAQQLNEPEPAESSIEYRIVRPDGAVRWILDRGYPVPGEAGAPTRVIGVSEDITVRKQLEQRFGLLSEEITDVITVVAPDGRISYASPSIHEALGYTPAEMEGSSAFDRVHPDDVDSVKRRFASVVAYPGATARAQYRMLDRTGAVRHVESVVRSLIDNPAIGGVVMSSRDITERVHIEQDLRESQRLQAVGRLAGGIAHDFNNLMTVIRSQTELLLLDQPAGPLARDINVIQAAADRAATLTAQLLAFSKDQVLRPEIVDACDIVRGMDRILDRAVGDRVTLVLDLPETVPSIQVDPAQLEQVVMNLVVNARDAMPHGGTVRISARLENGDRDEIPAASDRQGTPNPCVLLRVEDTGVGMSEDVRSRAFEPFYSTKPRGKGTGLGLATAYGFISQSGGTIDIESAPGLGTAVLIRLPVVAASPTERRPRAGAAAEADAVTGRILVVEDDPNVSRVTCAILQRAGANVTAVDSAEEAMAALEAGLKTDVVLTDLGLPGMTGHDLVKHVRERYPELALIVMSGYDVTSPGSPAELPPDVAFVQKPFTRRELLRAIHDKLPTG